jgi:uncharacterized protein
MKRQLYRACGLLMCGLGIIGAFVPLMPSSIFFLAAVWFFARSSPRLERWVLDHPQFGPPLRLWIEHRAVSRRMKIAAVIAMTFGLAFFALTVHPTPLVLGAVALFFTVCGVVIWRRSEGPVSASLPTR